MPLVLLFVNSVFNALKFFLSAYLPSPAPGASVSHSNHFYQQSSFIPRTHCRFREASFASTSAERFRVGAEFADLGSARGEGTAGEGM
jgi:hypothetical protein